MVRSFALRYYSAALAPAAAFLSWAIVFHTVVPRPFFPLFAAVIVSSADAGLIAGLVACLLGVLLSLLSFGTNPATWLSLKSSSLADVVLFASVAILAVIAQETLRRRYAEESFAASYMHDSVCVLDMSGRIMWVNSATEHLLGASRRALIGRKFHGTVCHSGPGDRTVPPYHCSMVQALKTDGKARVEEYVLHHPDRSMLRVEATFSSAEGKRRKSRVVVSLRDVTALGEMVESLREQERMYRELVTHAPTAMILLDEYGYIAIANERAATTFHMEAEQDLLKGMTLQQLLVPEDRIRVAQERHRALELDAERHMEITVLRPDGTMTPADVFFSPIWGASEEARMVACVVITESERRATEAGYYIEARVDGPDPEVVTTSVLADSDTLLEGMPRLLQALGTAGGWDVGAFWSMEPPETELRCRAIWRLPSLNVPEFEILCQQLAFPAGVDLPGRVLESRECLWISDVVADAGMLRALMASKEGLRSAFAFPVLSGTGVHGVIEFFSKEVRPPNAFLEEKMGLIGRQMGRFVDRRRSERSLVHQARHDALTNLPNRVLLNDRLPRAIQTARTSSRPVGVLLVDLDRFKQVNDSYGHHVGDLLLQQVAVRLREVLRDSDTVARLGGDEFAVILPGAPESGARVVADKIVAALHHPFAIEGYSLEVGGSVGIAIYPDHADDAQGLMQLADSAMYEAKRTKCGIQVYGAEPQRRHG